jgi:hypothetical protein
MAALGYVWRADALVETLAQGDEVLRLEARRALEDLAGELRGADPDRWRAWLASLPDGTVAGR